MLHVAALLLFGFAALVCIERMIVTVARLVRGEW